LGPPEHKAGVLTTQSKCSVVSQFCLRNFVVGFGLFKICNLTKIIWYSVDNDDNPVDVVRLCLKLQVSTGLLFHELGKPWWNDISRGKRLILPLELSVAIIPAESFSSKTGVIGEGSDELCLAKYPFHTSKGF
jgi:hypothetical protein